MDRAADRRVRASPLRRHPSRGGTDGVGMGIAPARAARCHPGSVRRAGHRLHGVDGAEPGSGRGSDHLSDFDRVAFRTEGQLRARDLDVRNVVRQRDLRGRHRHLLGAEPRARIPERRHRQASQGRGVDPGPRRHGRGLGVRVRARGQDRQARPAAAALDPGLERSLRAAQRSRRRRSGQRRRLRQAVPGERRSEQARGAQREHGGGHAGRDPLERRRRRARARDRGARARDSGSRIRAGPGRHRTQSDQGGERDACPCERRRDREPRA